MAYVLHHQDGLTFARGVCVGDEPALFAPALGPGMRLWLEVGAPRAKKLRQGLRWAEQVIVYAYDRRVALAKTLNGKGMERVQVYWLDRPFLEAMAVTLTAAVTHWQVAMSGEALTVNGLTGSRRQLPSAA